MKKSIKFFLIFGLVFLLIGTGMSFAALAMGAEFIGTNNRYYRSFFREYRPTSASSEETNYTPFKTADITELELELGAGNIYVEVSDELTDEIRVLVIQGQERFDYEVEEGKLKIEYLQNLKGILKKEYMDNELLIQVPAGFQFHKVDLEIKAGGIWFDKLDAKKLEAEISAGGVEVLDGSVGELELEVKAGGAKYVGSVSGNIKAECNTGGIELILDGEKKDFDYKAKCMVGFIEIDGDTIVGFGGDASQKNNATKKMDLECNTGGIDITFQ